MKTKKCGFCGIQHKNSEVGGELKYACQNCSFITESLANFVLAINQWVPSTTGKCNRRLTIKEIVIEKI